MGEFELIQRYFATHKTGVAVVGVGDDGAVLDPLPLGQQQVVCLDTMVAGRHFFDDADAADVGWKSLAVNLSDLAAMGATPHWFQLGLTLPQANESWLAGFAEGLFECADKYGIALIGGDTTSGPLSITVQAAGYVPAGEALLRSGAEVGDGVYVSGKLGGAALALQNAGADQQPMNRPTPRLELGHCLLGKATSAIDISDGLLADCSHVLQQSGVGGMLRLGDLPLATGIDESNLELALAGGDDYELLVTLPPGSDVAALEKSAHCSLVRIGTIEAEAGLRCVSADGAPYNPEKRGWQHFSDSQ